MSADPVELNTPPAAIVDYEYRPRHGRHADEAVYVLPNVPLQRTESLEPDVDGELSILGDSWRILNQIPVSDRGADIDQVAIGPGGVFAVHTADVPNGEAWVVGGEIRVSRITQPHVRGAGANAKRAARLLSTAAGFAVDVHGIVGVEGTTQAVTVKARLGAGAVHVVPRGQIAGFLYAQPAVLTPDTMNRIWAVARHLSTWQPGNLRKDDFWSGR